MMRHNSSGMRTCQENAALAVLVKAVRILHGSSTVVYSEAGREHAKVMAGAGCVCLMPHAAAEARDSHASGAAAAAAMAVAHSTLRALALTYCACTTCDCTHGLYAPRPMTPCM
jgi:hypothetical protein